MIILIYIKILVIELTVSLILLCEMDIIAALI